MVQKNEDQALSRAAKADDTTHPMKLCTLPDQRKKQKIEFLLILVIIAAATLITYFQLPKNHFVLYDDPEYITENVNVLGGLTIKGLHWAFSSIYQGNWHPLTWLSHMLDVELFGLNPAGHHLTALSLHLGNALLLFALLVKVTNAPWRSALVALLFALHPLHVESVAWASERKDLLCAFFWLLTMRGYAWYIERPGWRRYLLVFALFSAGLLTKPMIVTLPFALLLLDFWPLKRIAPGDLKRFIACIGEKIPLLLLSAALSIMTYRAQVPDTPLDHDTALFYRISNALQAYPGYLAKTFLPIDLAVAYPFDISRLTMGRTAGAAMIIGAITLWAIREWRRRPYLITGWLWFLGTLVPVIGIVKIGVMSMADRYTYIPLIGIFLMLSWSCADLVAGSARGKRILAIAATVSLALLACLTAKQLNYWQNGITLMEHALVVTDDNWFANNNLGAAYLLVGTNNKSLNISSSLPLEPATAQRRMVYLKHSITLCKEAVRISPNFPLARINLSLAYLNIGDKKAAMNEYRALSFLNLAQANNMHNRFEF